MDLYLESGNELQKKAPQNTKNAVKKGQKLPKMNFSRKKCSVDVRSSSETMIFGISWKPCFRLKPRLSLCKAWVDSGWLLFEARWYLIKPEKNLKVVDFG